MNAEEYWASEISDADIDAIANAGDFHLEENGFFFMPSQAEMRTLAGGNPALLRVEADGTNVLKVPLLIVEPKQKLIPSAADYVIPETAYDTIRTPIIFDFNRRVIIPWSVRRIGTLGDNTVELLSDVPDPLLNFSQVLRAGR